MTPVSAETTALAYSNRRHPERAVGGQAKDLAGWDITPSEALIRWRGRARARARARAREDEGRDMLEERVASAAP